MNKAIVTVISLLLITGPSLASDYKSTISSWKTYDDVGGWLEQKWRFSNAVAVDVSKTIRTKGPDAAPEKSAEETFVSPNGWCKDAASFAKSSLNLVNPAYKAEYIFIKNKNTRAANHWVTGFRKDGDLYVMDYGAGAHWKQMMGLHGPYKSLDEYRAFLSNLNIDNFQVDFVRWRPSENQGKQPPALGPKEMKARQRAPIVLSKFDRDGNGSLSKEEAPVRMKANFTKLDKDGDNSLSEEELWALPPQ